MHSYFEMLMLFCFGVSWPVAIWKTYKTKTAHGKSFKFLFFVLSGYVFGIIHKVLYNMDFVTILYAINLMNVFIEILLSWHYVKNSDYKTNEKNSSAATILD